MLLAGQGHGAPVVLHGVLYNGKPQSRAAGGLGMAFIHPVKAFKNAFLLVFGDSDPVICYYQNRLPVFMPYLHMNFAALIVIPDRIRGQILTVMKLRQTDNIIDQ